MKYLFHFLYSAITFFFYAFLLPCNTIVNNDLNFFKSSMKFIIDMFCFIHIPFATTIRLTTTIDPPTFPSKII